MSKRIIQKVAFIGTHSPRKCGIATFTADVAAAVASTGVDCQVVAMNDGVANYDYPSVVSRTIDQNTIEDYLSAATFLNQQGLDTVCVEHEFGIFGGPAGCYLLTLLRNLNVPIVTTFHTILEKPNVDQYAVVMELSQLSDRLLVMSQRGKKILEQRYEICASKIEVIPHGIPVPIQNIEETKECQILTFGLIGPSKGIENMIQALPAIVEKHPDTVYVVAGATHPNIVREHGEEYRESLLEMARELGVSRNLRMVDRFLELDELSGFLQDASIYVTPYLNKDQITSGTLAYAFGSGNAVVSTPYYHAEELLANDRGVIVPFGDTGALADAINGLLDEPERLAEMQRNAFALGEQMQWPVIGQRMVEMFARVALGARAVLSEISVAPVATKRPKLNLSHVLTITDDTGIIQHSTHSIPNRHEGYCTDDNARLALLGLQLQNTEHADIGYRFQSLGLSFMHHALDESTGRFKNFMSYDRNWLESVGSEDSQGRALWALGRLASGSHRDGVRNLAGQTFGNGVAAVLDFSSPRAWAFSLLGICAAGLPRRRVDIATELGNRLLDRFHDAAHHDWPWFENSLNYDNARLSQALIQAGATLGDDEMISTGVRSLNWLCEVQTSSDGLFLPIGSDGFYVRNGKRAIYDQQPLEALATIEACQLAFEVTANPVWIQRINQAFGWFTGGNILGATLFDPQTGAGFDGLSRFGANSNQGAESTMAYLASLLHLNKLNITSVEEVKGAYLG